MTPLLDGPRRSWYSTDAISRINADNHLDDIEYHVSGGSKLYL
jgi:hypothetical protein